VSALSDVQRDAALLAKSGALSSSVHLSGCGKSCAVPGAADFTLVAISGGLYDLYHRAPGGDGRFGSLIAEHIDPDSARRLMMEHRV
jgi:precorrin-3B synthase